MLQIWKMIIAENNVFLVVEWSVLNGIPDYHLLFGCLTVFVCNANRAKPIFLVADIVLIIRYTFPVVRSYAITTFQCRFLTMTSPTKQIMFNLEIEIENCPV